MIAMGISGAIEDYELGDCDFDRLRGAVASAIDSKGEMIKALTTAMAGPLRRYGAIVAVQRRAAAAEADVAAMRQALQRANKLLDEHNLGAVVPNAPSMRSTAWSCRSRVSAG